MKSLSNGIRSVDWRRALMLTAFVFSSLSCLSCSTPKVPDIDSENYSSLYDAYQSCVQYRVEFGTEHECDRMRSANGRGLSYDQYYGVNYEYANTRPWQPRQRRAYDGSDLVDPYAAYLYSLDQETQAQMAEEWKRLAEEAGQPTGQQTPPWEQDQG